jgi:hypothetical protein
MATDDFRVNCSVTVCGVAFDVLAKTLEHAGYSQTESWTEYDEDEWFGTYLNSPRKGSRQRAVPHGLQVATGQGPKGTVGWFGYGGEEGAATAHAEVHLYTTSLERAKALQEHLRSMGSFEAEAIDADPDDKDDQPYVRVRRPANSPMSDRVFFQQVLEGAAKFGA